LPSPPSKPLSRRRYVDGVPLWGDSEGWPLTAQDHAERDAYYAGRRGLSEDDLIDYNTVVSSSSGASLRQKSAQPARNNYEAATHSTTRPANRSQQQIACATGLAQARRLS
jgi:hypothetical protein